MPRPRPSGRPRQRKKAERGPKNTDNALAIKVSIAAVVAVAILFVFISLASNGEDEDDGGTAPRGQTYEEFARLTGGGQAPARPETDSPIPATLARDLLVAIANEDETAIDRIVAWPIFFGRLAAQNAWLEERRWENLDELGRETLKERYLLELLDPDLVEVLQQRALDSLLDDSLPPTTTDVGADHGTIGYTFDDDQGRRLVDIFVISNLLEGYDPVADAANPQAWRVVRIQHEIHRGLTDPKRKTKGREDVGAALGQPEEKPSERKKRSRFAGPPEADIAPVAWLPGTSDQMKMRVEDLVRRTVDDSDIRAAERSRDELGAIGKTAIPGILNGLAGMDYTNNREFRNMRVLIDCLQTITGLNMGISLGGLTQTLPEDRKLALRRWFGWWQEDGPSWEKKDVPPSTDEDEEFFGGDGR